MTPDLAGKQVLVWGIGRHGGGVAVARFCAKHGARVRLLDGKPLDQLGDDGRAVRAAGWEHGVGDATHPWFSDADMVVPSPAIPPRAWPRSHPPIMSPEAFFFAAHRGPRIAVTGTKGKSTTALMVGTLLGWDVAGNSYEPLLAWFDRQDPAKPVVCELSSFQLWYLREQRPHFSASIIVNLGRDHLDWHPDLADYQGAKLALTTWSDATAVHDDVAALLPPGVSRLSPQAAQPGLWTSSDLGLLGEHNRSNASLAVAVALHLGCARSEVAPRMRTVKPLPHRLQLIHQHGGLRFIDDSIATTPESAIAGMESIDGPLAVVLGGSDKGATWEDLASAVVRRHAVAVVIGTTGPAIAAAIIKAGGTSHRAADLDAAVRCAVTALPKGGTILLSPACASLDMFRGFEHRGDCFAEAARRIDA